MLKVSLSMSANSKDAPQYSTLAAVAINVLGEHIIISFCAQPKLIPIKCRAAVPLDTATAYLQCNFFVNAISNLSTYGPCVIF